MNSSSIAASSSLPLNTTTTAKIASESSTEQILHAPLAHLLPIFLMGFILLLLLLACLYDCKVNRDCLRWRHGTKPEAATNSKIYLYDGETGESKPSNRI